MKLTLTHSDITKALCQYLQTQGMTAFDPNVVTAEFAFKRGSKELTCELDTEAKVVVEADPKSQSDVTPTVTTSAPVVQPQEAASVVVAEEPAPVVTVEALVVTTAETPVLEPAGGDDDNLFD